MAEQKSQALIYLSKKKALLNNPGTKMSDVYYSKANTKVEMAEVTYNNGKYQSSLNSLVFGGTGQIIIPIDSLLSTTYLSLTLPAIVANQTLCRGWGYACIDEITYTFGSSTIPQKSITGDSLFQVSMQTAQNAEKRNELFRNAGEEQTVSAGAKVNRATMVLPLPWSSTSGLFEKKPFDTTLLTNPIIITVKFKRPESIYGGTGLRPAAFTSATIFLKQGEFKNKDLSLRSIMMRPENRGLKYNYPFIYHQSYGGGFVGGNGLAGVEQLVNFDLLSIIQADFVGLTFAIVEYEKRVPANDQSSKQPFSYAELADIKLKFNGNVVYDAPGNMYKTLNMDSITGASYVHNSDIDQKDVAEPFTSDPVDTYMVSIDFSRLRSISYEGNYANVWRIGNNALSLSFKIPDGSKRYQVYATYHYNATASISEGDSTIMF